jgi:hypothetical protein
VQVTIGDSEPFPATLDYLSENFLGLRTETALYRFFGRNAFGATVGLTIHVFDPVDDAVAESAKSQVWLKGLYAN